MVAEVVLRALKHAWVTLESLHIPMALMGGIAVSAWKHVRATRDVDLLVGLALKDADQVLRKLAEANIRPKRQPPVLTLGQLHLLQLLYEPPEAYLDLQIDLLFAESAYQKAALARRTPAQLPDLDIQIFVLTCEDLILHKLLAGRIVDRADAAALLRVNRGKLDLSYLLHWIGMLALAPELAEVWEEAFPGESPPVSAQGD
jgi:hypothetical protein